MVRRWGSRSWAVCVIASVLVLPGLAVGTGANGPSLPHSVADRGTPPALAHRGPSPPSNPDTLSPRRTSTTPSLVLNRTLVLANGTVVPGAFGTETGVIPLAAVYDPETGDILLAGSASTSSVVSVVDPISAKLIREVPVQASSRALLYDPQAHAILVANSSGGTNLAVLNASTYRTETNVTVGTDPVALTEDTTSGEIYVANSLSQNLTVLSAFTLGAIASIPLTGTPAGLAYGAPGGNVYASESSNALIAVVNASANSVVTTWKVGASPQGLAYDPVNTGLYVTDGLLNKVFLLNTSIGTGPVVLNLTVGTNPTQDLMVPSLSMLYVANSGSGNVTFLNTRISQIVATARVGMAPAGMAWDPVNGDLYVGDASHNVSVLAGSVGVTVGNILLSVSPYAMTLDPSAHELFVSDYGGGRMLALSEAGVQMGDVALPGSSYPTGVTYVPLTDEVYVGMQGSSSIDAVNASTLQVVGTYPITGTPGASCYDPTGTSLVVASTGGYYTFLDPRSGSPWASGAVTNDTPAVACDTSNGEVFVPNAPSMSVRGNLTVINGTSHALQASVPAGIGPSAVTFDPVNGYAYVADAGGSTVTVVDGRNLSVVATVNVPCGAASGATIAYVAYGNAVYVTAGSTVCVVNTTSNILQGQFTLGQAPQAVVYDSAVRTAFVPDEIAGTAYLLTPAPVVSGPTISTFTASPPSITLGASATLTVSASGGTAPITYQYSGLPPGCSAANLSSLTCTPTAAGVFLITVNVTDHNGLSASATTTLTVSAPLAATIAFDSPSTGPAPLTVALSAGASGGVGPFGYTWNFGDGTSGTGLTVTHTWTSSGVHQVVLDVTDGAGARASATANVFATGSAGLTAQLVFDSPSLGYAPFNVTFSGSATGGTAPYNFTWSFGDGSSGAGPSVSHAYGTLPAGCTTLQCPVNVTLVVRDATGAQSSTTAQVILLSGSSPPLSLTLDDTPGTGLAPLPVTFHAGAAGGYAPYSFVWSFGDGTSASGTFANHTYLTPGTYTVLLTGSDAAGHISQVSATVVVLPSFTNGAPGALQIAISAAPATGPAPLNTRLTAEVSGGSGPYALTWLFGNGGTAHNVSSVNRTYSFGSYAVTLAVSDAAGDQAITGIFILATGTGNEPSNLTAFVAVPSMSGAAPLELTCIPAVRGGTAPYELSWDFGDHSPIVHSSGLLPQNHTYSSAGAYYPTVSVNDSAGHSLTWSTKGTGLSVAVSAGNAPGRGSPGMPDWVIYAVLGVAVVTLATVLIIGKRKVIFR